MAPRIPTLAQAMYPALRSNSPEAKRREAAEAWAQEWVRKEQKASNARTVERLRQINEKLRQEKR